MYSDTKWLSTGDSANRNGDSRHRNDWLSTSDLVALFRRNTHLAGEGITDNVFVVGNLMGEAFSRYASKPWKDRILLSLAQGNIEVPEEYYYMTCHRQENTRNDNALKAMMMAMESLDSPTVFPVHPRNKERVVRLINELGCSKILAVEPVGYFESIHLIKGAKQVVTDSGGVLTETFFAGVPYVYVMDMPKPPERTPFDVTRLAKPLKNDIMAKLQQPFDATVGPALCKKNAGTGQRILEIIAAKYVEGGALADNCEKV